LAISLHKDALSLPGYSLGTLARMPLAGGAPREILEGVQDADWSPDGKELAITRPVNGNNRLELPIGRVLLQANHVLLSPRVSPRGDMVAFIEGHGMRRFHGYVDYEEVQSVVWKTEDNPDSWKDFVELAKAAAAPFLTMDSWMLRREELDQMIERLSQAEFTNDEDVDEARWLKTYVGKTGFVQLGFGVAGAAMARFAAAGTG
jgi:hypothetical protein